MFFKLIVLVTVFLLNSSLSYADARAKAFFKSESMTSARMNPSGSHIAAIISSDENQRLILMGTSSLQKKTLLDLKGFTKKKAGISGISWIDDQHIAMQFSEIKKGVKDLLDTRSSQYLVVVRIPDKKKTAVEVLSVKTDGWLVDALPDEKNVFLYAKGGPYSKIYKIDVNKLNKKKQKLSKLSKKDGGQFVRLNEVKSIEGYASRWFVSHNGSPKGVLNYTNKKELVLSVFGEGNKSEKIKTWSKKDLNWSENDDVEKKRLFPVALADEENTFYCLDLSEEEERTVYKVNFKTGQQSVVYESDSYKIIDLVLAGSKNKLVGVKVINDGKIRKVFLDNTVRNAFYDEPLEEEASFRSEVDRSKSGKLSLVYQEGHTQPGSYWLQTLQSGKKRYVGSLFPKLYKKLNSRLVMGSVKVEGLDIPYLLTLPDKKNKKPYPLIVQPHGGPIGVFDHQYFDVTTQFFADHGYAVLRVNYRGSAGYNKELKEAGKKQWGKLILSDIHSSVLNVLGRPDIAGGQVCIIGFSYGGYAATMLSIMHPETYNCAVNVAGVSDINLYLNDPGNNERQRRWLKEYVGDVETEYAALKAISPAYLIERLQRPILVMHGDDDDVVDVEHAYRLKRMLEKYNKPFQWHIFHGANHNFSEVDETLELFSKVAVFVADHIKGE